MKKIALLIGAAICLLGTQPALAATFPDVPRDHANYKAIDFLEEAGIIRGYPDGSFKPQQTINRAEALKIVLLAKEYLGEKVMPDEVKNLDFPDVGENDWFYSYVRLAFSAGIVQGYPDGSFKPGQEINAVESLKVVLKTVDEEFSEYSVSENPYVDVASDAWFASYVDYAKNRQLIEAFADYKYLPSRQMSRAGFAELIFRVIYLKEHDADKFPLSLNWNYCNNYQEGYKIKYPHTWLRFKAGNQFVFWKQDKPNGQTSFARVFPNSATVIVVNDENVLSLSLEEYVNLIDYGPSADTNFLTLNDLPYASVFVEETGLQDSYFEMPNGNILVIYAQIGNGEIGPQLKEEIRYMIGSVRSSYEPSSDSYENCLAEDADFENGPVESGVPVSEDMQKLSDLYEKVLVEDAGMAAIEALGETVIIDTDTIGIGTGPIDYYYSEAFNVTIKYERDSDTILATKNGNTTAF